MTAAGHALHRHAHVGHRAHRPLVHRRHRRLHSWPGCEGATSVAVAGLALREDGVSPVLCRLHDYVVGLGDADAELVHRHRLHRVAVRGDHGHGQAGNAHVVEGHRRAVDEAQAHPLAGPEQPGPVRRRRLSVDQEGVGGTGHVGDVGRTHAHPAPHQPVMNRRAKPVLADVGHKSAERTLVEVVVVGLKLEVAHHGLRITVRPVREHHHVLAVRADRVHSTRGDDDGTTKSLLFLETGMAVIPEGAALPHRELVGEGLTRRDAVEAKPGHPVHVRWQAHPVPVDGTDGLKPVGDRKRYRVALLPPQHRAGQSAVHGDGRGWRAGDVHRQTADRQVEVRTGKRRNRGTAGSGAGEAWGAECGAGHGETLHEAAPRDGGARSGKTDHDGVQTRRGSEPVQAPAG